uniref:Uncharacterized protein n=1 Tax=Cajanus cajan TaxID=3821 RepID=A0A151SN45_CAJCA|nr:hypothetical protein KK1_002497 [Cajanus cajan]
MLPSRFSFFGGGDSHVSNSAPKGEELSPPTLKLETDKLVYRPGDPVVVTIQISNPSSGYSFLMERLSFEIKGIEKLDTQWFATQKPLPGSKQRRGEHAFLECSTPVLVANQIVNAGASKSYVVRMLLPSIIPPSYKGSNIRYLYYVKSAFTGGWIIFENGQSRAESKNDVTDVEVRIPLQIWINQKSITMDDDIVPLTAVQLDIFWKEMDGDADWGITHLKQFLSQHFQTKDLGKLISVVKVKSRTGKITTTFVNSSYQLEDVLTKSLRDPQISYISNKLGAYDLYAPA